MSLFGKSANAGRASWGRRFAACFLSICLLAVSSSSFAGKSYAYFAVGKVPATKLTLNPSTPSVVLMGGGPEVDEAFTWMIQRAGVAPGTGGRFVVIRATGTDAYNPYIYYSDANNTTSTTIAPDYIGGAALGLSSVETLIIPSLAAANDAFVNSVVANANAVWIAGGDQSDYIKYWKGTALEKTLNTLMSANIPIGGTSAGLAVLGNFDFAALNGAVTSSQALANPYNKYMTLDPSPLSGTPFLASPGLTHTVVDAHFGERDRMGRLLAFVARLVAPTSSNGTTLGCPGGVLTSAAARGIGVDIETALLVQGNGTGLPYTGKTVGLKSVYFIKPSISPTSCAAGKPLGFSSIQVLRAPQGASFDLTNWTGTGTSYTLDVVNGALTSASPY